MQKFHEKILIDSASPQERRSFIKKLTGVIAATAALGGFTNISAKNTYSGKEVSAFMSPDPYLGSIGIFAGNFAIRQWAFCHGQLLAISSNSALFSLLGCTFGGDCRTTFALPDLRGRTPIGVGQGPGLTDRPLGQKSGQENVILNILEIPSHNHTSVATVKPKAFEGRSGDTSPVNNFPGTISAGTVYNETANAQMAENPVNIAIGNTGGNQSHNNMMPFLALHYQIAIQGIFPPRS